MNRRRNAMISLAAAVLSGLLVYGIYSFQLQQLERQETVRVVVPKRLLPAGARLAADDFEYRAIARSSYDAEQMLLDASQVEGMEAVVPLGQGEPLLLWKIDRFRLMPGSDQSTFQIPREYVLSVSNGIRAGDKVVVYVSGGPTESARLFEDVVTVASVKTSGNVEIDDLSNPNLLSLARGDRERMYASRRDANGMIDYINLNLTEQQWLTIDNLCRTGESKLVIAYSPLSLDVTGAAPEVSGR
ncbi:SAF domain-containing protein [Paenibacillus cisolokensis]|uniref:SAF domain-containing protein n=1 Tax=Paenibacillus TaxID=44249 RepID=UPI0007802808|nr:SAF domain-containing protein [Paenibacillus sp. 32O-W]